MERVALICFRLQYLVQNALRIPHEIKNAILKKKKHGCQNLVAMEASSHAIQKLLSDKF